MSKKISKEKRDILMDIAKESYPKLPLEIASMCLSEDELNTMNNCISMMPFYQIGNTDKYSRADKLKSSFQKHLNALKELATLPRALTIAEIDTLMPLLDKIEVPSFKYATNASHKQHYLEYCRAKMTTFGKVRGENVRSLLSDEFDIRSSVQK